MFNSENFKEIFKNLKNLSQLTKSRNYYKKRKTSNKTEQLKKLENSKERKNYLI